MCSSPPTKAPKSQLAVEQPLSGGCWNPPKTPHIQRQRRSHSKMAGGHNYDKIKSYTLPVGKPQTRE